MANYFDTVAGQNMMDNIASSLNRIARALEMNNALMEKALKMENHEGKRIASTTASAASAASKALDDLSSIV